MALRATTVAQNSVKTETHITFPKHIIVCTVLNYDFSTVGKENRCRITKLCCMKTVALLRRCPLLIGMTLLIFFFSQRTYQLQQRRAGVVVHGFFSPSITTIGPKRRCVYTDRNYLHTTSPMIISKINKQGRVLRIASSCLRRSRLFSSWHSFSAINSNSYDSTDRLPRSTLFSTIQSASSTFRASMTAFLPETFKPYSLHSAFNCTAVITSNWFDSISSKRQKV